MVAVTVIVPWPVLPLLLKRLNESLFWACATEQASAMAEKITTLLVRPKCMNPAALAEGLMN